VLLTRLDLRGVGTDVGPRLPRPAAPGPGPEAVVREILAAVRAGGDAALREYAARYDGLADGPLRVPPERCRAALAALPHDVRAALEVARDAVVAYHRSQLVPAHETCWNGVRLRAVEVPVDRAGCYVPGGRAAYPSTVVMTAAVAKVAGVPEVVVVVPPDRTSGWPPDPVLAAAALCGVDEVYRIGGAQAIGALAYGTETIRPVDAIVGPGNAYVALAQRQVAAEGRVGIPAAFAGPSEVVVIADGSAPVDFAAIDVLVQAEHGPDGLAWFVTWSPAVADAVTDAVRRLTEASPRRAELEATFARSGYAVVVDSPEAAVAVANAIAPEHLELQVADPEALLPLVRHAGAVFTGPWSPASLGDYVAGPSHVLPTFGSARFGSALTVRDFTKHVHVVSADEAALRRAAPHVAALARVEGLVAHADSVLLRTRGAS
jgi:histidinol dehydrogenase